MQHCLFSINNEIPNTIKPQFEARGLINFMAQNQPGSNRERVEIETINLDE